MFLSFLTSTTGLVAMAFYFYTAVLAGRASAKSGHSIPRVVVDAATWPVMMWQTIEDLYKAPEEEE